MSETISQAELEEFVSLLIEFNAGSNADGYEEDHGGYGLKNDEGRCVCV